jgi:hypothetical protein
MDASSRSISNQCLTTTAVREKVRMCCPVPPVARHPSHHLRPSASAITSFAHLPARITAGWRLPLARAVTKDHAHIWRKRRGEPLPGQCQAGTEPSATSPGVNSPTELRRPQADEPSDHGAHPQTPSPDAGAAQLAAQPFVNIPVSDSSFGSESSQVRPGNTNPSAARQTTSVGKSSRGPPTQHQRPP